MQKQHFGLKHPGQRQGHSQGFFRASREIGRNQNLRKQSVRHSSSFRRRTVLHHAEHHCIRSSDGIPPPEPFSCESSMPPLPVLRRIDRSTDREPFPPSGYVRQGS